MLKDNINEKNYLFIIFFSLENTILEANEIMILKLSMEM